MEGVIFSIEEFAINDGPGLRTTVFLKGCPLKCEWCHNPEGVSFAPQILSKKNGVREMCGEKISSEELARKLLKNEKIFALNDGGITFTGGEPLAQAEFLLDTISKIKGRIHVAIETSGFASPDVFCRVARAVDLVLIDSKAMDSEVHKRFTGVDNAGILENLKWLSESGIPFIVRVPLIPSVNDSLENAEKLRDALSGAKNLKRVELLRYHKTAGAKYYMLGKTYAPHFDTTLPPKVFNGVFTDAGIDCIVL